MTIVDDIVAVKGISDEIEKLSDSDIRLLCWMVAAEINEREERQNGIKSNTQTER